MSSSPEVEALSAGEELDTRAEIETDAQNISHSSDGSNSLNEKENLPNSNNSLTEDKTQDENEESLEVEKGNGILRLPLARVKKIMKADPVLGLASQDSVFLIAKATELFIESLVVEAYQNMVSGKKKTIARRDFDTCVEKIDSLAFLDGALDE